MQVLSDALVDVGEGIDETPAEEYTMMLEVTMADCPWMVMHILKNDRVLRELEHMQVDGLGTAYLFFYDKQGCRGLGQDTAYAIQAHMKEAFSGWISCSAHFTISLLPLIEVWWQAVATSDRCRLRSQAENPVPSIPVVNAGESDSSVQLVGSAPQQAWRSSPMEEMAEARLTTHAGAAHLHGWPPKSQCTVVGGVGSPPSSPDRGAPNSDGYSTASETTVHWH